MAQVVWVLEVGCYSDRYVDGVYASRDAALAANPVREPTDRERLGGLGSASAYRPGGWQPSDPDDPDNCDWSNGLDWGEAAHLQPMEVQT